MAKKQRKQPVSRTPTRVPTTAEAAAKRAEPKNPSARGGRETVDALVIAVVLAFLIRTFQAEAFVIPTGSMAPTLMGAHKDVFCDQCGQRFRVNASEESGEQLQAMVQAGRLPLAEARKRLPSFDCVAGVCPECRYVMPIRGDRLERLLPAGTDETPMHSTYSGDRLVVSKTAYTFSDPDRWDILVFKYPGNATTNYIKRLVGLPNESLKIYQGDLFAKPKDEPVDSPHAITRKPADKAMVTRQLVHDTDREPLSLYRAGWPARWRGDDAWKIEVEETRKNAQRRFKGEAGDGEPLWLRYHHTPPGEGVWRAVTSGADTDNLADAANPQLVTDFTAYNTRILRQEVIEARQYTARPTDPRGVGRVGVHWVGDLMLEADIEVESDSGNLLLELVEAGEHYRCAIDVATGKATLSVIPFESSSEDARPIADASTPIRGKGDYELRLANFDDQLLLWVDGKLVDMDGRYEIAGGEAARRERIPRTSAIDPGDLAPAGVGLDGALATIERLRIYRDIYYIADSWQRKRMFVNDYDINELSAVSGVNAGRAMIELPSMPEWWPALEARRSAEFETGPDQFFMMGDNSAESLDSRLWLGGNQRDVGRPGGSYLERSQLVGKAIWVYWPHAWYTVPYLKFGGREIPVWPNFSDMRSVR